jgi:hypothetical protein
VHNKSTLYKAIRDRLKDKLPQLWIDLQKGQFKKASEDYPVPLPAALIEFGRISWSEFSKTAQKGNASVIVHLYLANRTDTFEGSEMEEESLTILDDQDAIYDNLQGLSGDGFDPLERKSELPQSLGQGWICFATEFTTTLYSSYPTSRVLVQKNQS